jgi:hypothetical protein
MKPTAIISMVTAQEIGRHVVSGPPCRKVGPRFDSRAPWGDFSLSNSDEENGVVLRIIVQSQFGVTPINKHRPKNILYILKSQLIPMSKKMDLVQTQISSPTLDEVHVLFFRLLMIRTEKEKKAQIRKFSKGRCHEDKVRPKTYGTQ